MYVFEKLFVFISAERGGAVKGGKISPQVRCGKEGIWKQCVSILATCHVMRGGLWDPSLEIFISFLCLSFSPRKLSYLSSYPLDGRC